MSKKLPTQNWYHFEVKWNDQEPSQHHIEAMSLDEAWSKFVVQVSDDAQTTFDHGRVLGARRVPDLDQLCVQEDRDWEATTYEGLEDT